MIFVEMCHGAPLQFTDAAKNVLFVGRELWRYYHTMPDANPNASLYDIKERQRQDESIVGRCALHRTFRQPKVCAQILRCNVAVVITF